MYEVEHNIPMPELRGSTFYTVELTMRLKDKRVVMTTTPSRARADTVFTRCCTLYKKEDLFLLEHKLKRIR